MIDDWLNQNPDDGFDLNDHGIEMDEIAKLHAMADMKEDQEIWAREHEKCHVCNEIKKGLNVKF